MSENNNKEEDIKNFSPVKETLNHKEESIYL
jgi:hypothetical protein